MSSFRKPVMIATLLACCLALAACAPSSPAPVVSASTPTAAPVAAAAGTPAAAAAPPAATPVFTPAPPTASPLPTPTPFSVYAPTAAMSFEELVGDNGSPEFPAGFPAPDTYRIIVDVCHQVVLVYSQDPDGNYIVPVRYMLCSTGVNGKTPVGTFKMLSYRVRFGLLSSLGLYTQYWSQIRNRIYFHSILYAGKDAATYVEDTYAMLGQPNTPGCVYLTVPDARWIYYHIAPDTEVEIREGDENDTQTAAIRAQLLLPPLPETLPALAIADVPDTDNWTIDEIPLDVPFVQGSQK